MSLLEWKPEYSVGIASMDDEHREMIGMINGVYRQMAESSEADEIESCLEEIFTTISAHFALEERIMREAVYEEFEPHKEDHEDLLDEIRDLTEDFLADTEKGGRLLEDGLSAWFSRHFSTFDARLHGKLGGH